MLFSTGNRHHPGQDRFGYVWLPNLKKGRKEAQGQKAIPAIQLKMSTAGQRRVPRHSLKMFSASVVKSAWLHSEPWIKRQRPPYAQACGWQPTSYRADTGDPEKWVVDGTDDLPEVILDLPKCRLLT